MADACLDDSHQDGHREANAPIIATMMANVDTVTLLTLADAISASLVRIVFNFDYIGDQ